MKASFDVDEKGQATLLSFTALPDSSYSKRVADILKTLRFRPGVRADGTPKRDTVAIEFSFSDEGSDLAVNGKTVVGMASGKGADVVTARSDGIEFPFPGYLNNIFRQIVLNFKPRNSAAHPKAEVRFLIHRDGFVSDLTFVRRSGNFSFDLEAQDAVEAASSAHAFGSLPTGFAHDALPVLISFDTGAYADEASDQQTYFEFQVEKPAEMLRDNPKPKYPSVLESSGIAGDVQAQFVVRRDGKADMDSFKVLKSTSELFTEAVKSVLPSILFNPAMIGGKPVNQLVQLSFQFAVPR